MANVTIHLFGAPRVLVAGAPLVVDTRKAIALLAFLAVTRETHQRDTLATLFWPDYAQDHARAALRRTLSTLLRALQDHAAGDLLDISRSQISITPSANLWLDVAEFHRLLASLSTHDHPASTVCPACLPPLEQAAALASEPWMAGFSLRDSPTFDEWAFFQEETLRRELTGALEKLAFGLAASGRPEEALAANHRWLALDPLNEDAHRQMMQIYQQAGQRNAALRQYRECVRILDEELGVAPLDETTRLYQTILNHESQPPAAGRLSYTPHPAPAQTLAPAPLETTQSAPTRAQPAPPTPLVGRKSEVDALAAAYRPGFLAVLEGDAGIGKTRLAETFLNRLPPADAVVLRARCYPGEAGLAYAPFVAALTAGLQRPAAADRLQALPHWALIEAGRLVPEIASRAGFPPAPPSEEGAQLRFFEGLRQLLAALLAGPQPGVLFLDDLHWADHATLELLAYLIRRLDGLPLCILAAWRSEPNPAVETLRSLALEASRAGRAAWIKLDPLTQAEIAQLVKDVTPDLHLPPSRLQQFTHRLYQESEGSPFIALEYLAARPAEEDTAAWELPSSVRNLLRARLASLDSATLQLAGAAAVIGRSFDFHTLREASGRSEIETIDSLDELMRRGLIVEQPAPDGLRYDFTHEKLRGIVYEETSLTRRRLLHRRVAEAILHVPASRHEQAGRVAYHYSQAGMPSEAAEFHLLAGEHARRVFAIQDALDHFQAALAAGHPRRGDLHESIGDLQTLLGAYPQAIQSYQAAAALCAPGCLGSLEHKLGNVHHRLGQWDLADRHYQASQEVLSSTADSPSSDASLRVHLFADRSLVAVAQGDLSRAQALAEDAVSLARSTADRSALAQAWNALGVVAHARGDTAAAASALQESLQAARLLDDPLAQVAALNNLSLVSGESGDLEEAIRLAQSALELCQRRGDRHRQAALHNNLADLLHRAGQEEAAMHQLKQAVAIFAEIGSPGEQANPEIWKLTEW